MKVLVTGGAGYIGSHAVRHLLDQGYEVTVLDDLSSGHPEAVDSRAQFVAGSTADQTLLKGLLRARGIEAVMHFAAHIEVAESTLDPGKYYENNFSHTLRLLNAMVACRVKKIVFSSTAAVYGNPAASPILETEMRRPINPYGRSKMMAEMAIEDFSRAHGLGYAILRYFNVAGAHPDGSIGEDHHPESHLIPRLLLSCLNHGARASIFGTDYPTPDGTCVRDYVHVLDLVEAHRLALEKTLAGEGLVFNLGSERGFSVREVIRACERTTGKKIICTEEGRRPGDPATLVANSAKIKNQVGWEPRFSRLEDIIRHAWHWHRGHPQGYRAKLDDIETEGRRDGHAAHTA